MPLNLILNLLLQPLEETPKVISEKPPAFTANRQWIRKDGAEAIPFIDAPVTDTETDDPSEAFIQKLG